MELDDILRSGEPELIACLDGKTIIEHFGEDSFEYLAFEHYQAEIICRDKKTERKIIPRRTENPANIYRMLRNWLVEFHKANGMKLPWGFYRRNLRQLRGMYYGMLRFYRLTIDDIVPYTKE